MPWEDLRYLFGEILYGGHIVEDWDRRLSSAYLNKHFTENLLEGPELFPGFTTPPSNANHKMVGACIVFESSVSRLCGLQEQWCWLLCAQLRQQVPLRLPDVYDCLMILYLLPGRYA